MNRLFFGIALAASAATIAYAQSGQAPGRTPPASMLADYPGFGHDVERDMRAYVADEARRQQLIAQCMRNAGFEYYPETATLVRADSAAAAPARSKRPQSRNQVYRQGLQGDRLRQYDLALYGVEDPNSLTELWDPSSGTGGGCWGEALRSVRGVFDAARDLGPDYVSMRRSVARDARVTAAESRWASCMSAKGHRFASVSELRSAAANQGEVFGRPKMPMEQVAQASAASETCLAEASYAEAERQAMVDAENEFVRRHKSRLDQLRHPG
jgi:hypothetical protein